jgi:hypothetical protein
MKSIARVGFALLVVSLLATPIFAAKKAKKEGKASRWTTLFDASHTNGWEMVGPGELKLENGELVTYGGMGMLWYNQKKFGNCAIRVVFKLTSGDDNSGVFVRMPEKPKDPMQAVNQGYEVQIDNRGDEYHRTGCLYSLSQAKNKVNAKTNEWSTMVITLNGAHTIVKVDGEVVTDFTEGQPVPEKHKEYEPNRGPRPEFGYIGLQNHGGDAHVHFKEVQVRELKKAAAAQ